MSNHNMSRSNDSYRLVQGVKLARVEQDIRVTPYRKAKVDIEDSTAAKPEDFDIPRYGTWR
ncbi:hypothetical protein [Robiginitomaculum antarcticum]|uniref:hypothetical protein n=1 Tax=Robiginitomaculum antarcticum TaxID=437507 RepID=UPI00036498FE|nr:hypothetical protein [Robiginitomaculum antarcticum]